MVDTVDPTKLSDTQVESQSKEEFISPLKRAAYQIILKRRNDLKSAGDFVGNAGGQVYVKTTAPFKYNGCQELDNLVKKLGDQKVQEAAAKLLQFKSYEPEYEKDLIKRATGAASYNEDSKKSAYEDAVDQYDKAKRKDLGDLLDTDDRVRYKTCREIESKKKALEPLILNPKDQYQFPPGSYAYAKAGPGRLVRSAAEVQANAIKAYKMLQADENKVTDQTSVTTLEHIWEAHGTKIQVVGGVIVFAAGLLGPDEIALPVAAVVGGGTGLLAAGAGDYESAAWNIAGAIPLEKAGAFLGRAAFASKEAAQSALASKLLGKSSEDLAAMRQDLIAGGAKPADVDALIAARKQAEEHEAAIKKKLGEDDHTGDEGTTKKGNETAEACAC